MQRAVIVLRAKDVPFEVTYINLREKPGWFLEISPHGKVPVLHVDDTVLFESSAIAEYLDETVAPRLHPEDPLDRARHRAWTDFVVDFARGLSGVYYTRTAQEIADGLAAAPVRIAKLEEALQHEPGNTGRLFAGDRLSLVDAAYAPFLQRFALAESRLQTGLLADFPRVQAWSDAVLADPAVTGSVAPSFVDTFIAGLTRQGYHVGRLFAETPVVAAVVR